MSRNSNKLGVDLSVVLPETELPILAAVQQLGREMIKEREEPDDAKIDPLAYYGEWFMEDLSEAGYTETATEDRRSGRAFGRLLRIKPDDLELVKKALRCRRTEYHDFALNYTIIRALSRSTDLAPALPLLNPDKEAQPQGPFYPDCAELKLGEALHEVARQAKVNQSVTLQAMSADQMVANYLDQVVKDHRKVSEPLSAIDAAAVKLAGAFRLNKPELLVITSALITSGANNPLLLQVSLAYVVLETVRATPRLITGLKWAQPKSA